MPKRAHDELSKDSSGESVNVMHCKPTYQSSKKIQDTSPVESVLTLSLRPVYVVTRSEMMAYFALLEDPHIYDFLISDACMLYSDKYLLAMVFAYFKRANLTEDEYTRANFFVALFLANDIEEDEEDYKYEIIPWAYSENWRGKISSFLLQRDRLWARIGYRAIVSSRCCDEVMSMEPSHWAWQRQRLAHHVGAIRANSRDLDVYELRGPNNTPRGPCDQCASAMNVTGEASSSERQTNFSWYLSSSSSSSSSSSDDEILTFVNSRGHLDIFSQPNSRMFKLQESKPVFKDHKEQKRFCVES